MIRIAPLRSNEFTELITPQEYKCTLQDIDASTSTRSANGTMLRDRIAGGPDAKRKLEMQWAGLTAQEVGSVLRAIGDEFFQVEYPDTYTGEQRTSIFYVGDRSAEMYAYKLRDGDTIYKTLNANFIEQ